MHISCCELACSFWLGSGQFGAGHTAAVSTTYAVGELSALNAIAGAYAEHLPVFHLVGMPNMSTRTRASHPWQWGIWPLLSDGGTSRVCLTDFNSGAFTARIDRSKSINILHDHVRVGHAIFDTIEMKDVLQELAKRLPKRSDIKGPKVSGLGEPQGKEEEKITAEYLYPRRGQFLKPHDILIAESGTASLGMAFARMPAGSVFHNLSSIIMATCFYAKIDTGGETSAYSTQCKERLSMPRNDADITMSSSIFLGIDPRQLVCQHLCKIRLHLV
jgi:TPP-dependent 2-oxoacid decarboxylase